MALKHAGGYCRGMMRFSTIVLLGVAGTSLGSTVVQAEEKLPGVSEDHRIVKPLPEPIDGAPQERDAIKVGDWDVRVSGSVTIDIGTGNLPPPHR